MAAFGVDSASRRHGLTRPPPRPTLAPELGWQAFDIPAELGFGPNFVSGEVDTDRLRVRYFIQGEARRLVGKAWFGPGTQGPPGHAHGGSISALLDEAMGISAWVAGYAVVAARITINFREMLPVGTVVQFTAGIAGVDGSKIVTEGRLFGAGWDGVRGCRRTVHPDRPTAVPPDRRWWPLNYFVGTL